MTRRSRKMMIECHRRQLQHNNRIINTIVVNRIRKKGLVNFKFRRQMGTGNPLSDLPILRLDTLPLNLKKLISKGMI